MPEFNCPGCGQRLVVTSGSASNRPAGSWSSFSDFTDSTRRSLGDVTQPVPEFTEAYRDTPARAPSVEADWSVPWRRAMTTGVLFGLPLAAGVGIATQRVNFGQDLLWGCVIVGATVAVSWLLFLSTADSTLWIREKIVNKDLDSDRHIGKPPEHVEFVLKREDTDAEGDSWQLGKLPCPGGEFYRLQEFCQDIIAGHATFSEVGTRDGVKSGATKYAYSPTLWEDLRAEFINRGWVYWKNPDNHKGGTDFTRVGLRMLREIAES